MKKTLLLCAVLMLAGTVAAQQKDAAAPDPAKLRTASAEPGKNQPLPFLRNNFKLIFAAKKGEEITFDLESRMIGKQEKPIQLKVTMPDGQAVALEPLPIKAKQSYSFTPSADGFCILPVATGGAGVKLIPGANCRVSAYSDKYFPYWKGTFFQTFYPPVNTRFYFAVPKGVEEFQMEVGFNGKSTICILDGEGQEKARLEEMKGKKLVTLKRDKKDAEIWTVVLVKGTHNGFRFFEPVSPIVSFDKNDLAVAE